MVRRQSFLSNLFGHDTYANLKGVALYVCMVGAFILVALYILSYYFHSSVVSYLLNLTNGTSLLFIGYIFALIILLDIEVDVDEKEKNYWEKEKKDPKPFKYKLTIVWGVVLLALGIVAIYYSNKYRNHYAFECDTFLVDTQRHIYHVDWNDDCDVANEAEELEKRYGYEIDDSYTLCESCKDFLDEMESYESERYIRR